MKEDIAKDNSMTYCPTNNRIGMMGKIDERFDRVYMLLTEKCQW